VRTLEVLLEIRRYQEGQKARMQRYRIEGEPEKRVLDALMQIAEFQDPSLALRRSCGHKRRVKSYRGQQGEQVHEGGS
jgi:succinate dehydrogenase / fumarate reductase iron-sulfur subunit